MAKWSSQHNGKFPDPYAKLKFDKEEKKKDKKKKKQKKEKADREKENVPKQITDPNSNKVRRETKIRLITAFDFVEHLHFASLSLMSISNSSLRLSSMGKGTSVCQASSID